MENKELKGIIIEHQDNYRKVILDNIKNNTDVLVNQDIVSLLQKPPLDSMDLIRSKFLDLAKKNKIVLNTEELSVLLDNYRKHLLKCCSEIENVRVVGLSSKIEKEKLSKNTDTFKINRKDFDSINRKTKKLLKTQLVDGYQVCILDKIDVVFTGSVEDSTKKKVIDEMSKYVKGNYQRQLLENYDIKVMVKDITLINGIKEAGDRYLYTLNNSRLLNEIDS